ncbi:MAG: PAS domain S-box protein [Candidatus Melainabacteria bacterium]|nr:PAS domain S-box protein [Candidatus Melainabacteria bacterium]
MRSRSGAIKVNMFKLNIAHKGLIVVAVPLVLNLLILAGLAYLVDQESVQRELEEKNNALNIRLIDMRRMFVEALNLTWKGALRRDPSQYVKYEKLKERSAGNYQELVKMEADDPELLSALKHSHLLESRLFRLLDASQAIASQGGDGVLMFSEPQLQSEFKATVKYLGAKHEQFMLVQAQHQRAKPHNEWLPLEKAFLLFGVLANVIFSVSLSLYFGRNFVDRLKQMIDNTIRLAANQQLHPIIAGSDEISRLDTVYHEMAELLQQAHRKERSFIDNAVDVILTVDEKSKFADVNPASEQVWGYQPAELIGRTVASVVHVDDLPLFAGVDASKETGVNFENRVQHKDGRLIDMLWSAYWSKDEHTYFCVAHDITDRKTVERFLKESEARIGTIIENLPVGLLILNEQGNIEAVNPKSEELLGCGSHKLIAQHVGAYVDHKNDTDQASMQANAMSSLLEKCFQHSVELSCKRYDGTILPIEILIDELHFGKQRKFLAIMVDVSERHQLENARQELIQMVSHDLRTPLTSAGAIMDLLLTGTLGKLDETDLAMVAQSQRELYKLLALINGLLDLEKIQSGSFELNSDVSSASIIVAKATEAVVDLAIQSQVVLENHAKDSELLCDSERLVLVLVNLAMEAMRHNPPPQSIGMFAAESKDGNSTQFKVVARHRQGSTTDGETSAPGIIGTEVDSDGAATSLSTTVTSGTTGGSGLWQVICNGIVKAHNGTLELQEDGVEATYSFVIPLPMPPQSIDGSEDFD